MIYVLSDIHGHRRRFESVMNQIKLRADDTLYVLGDVVDRNPDGIRILRQLMAMPNVKLLLGNHELLMLNALYEPFCEQVAKRGKNNEQSLAQLPLNQRIEVGGRSYLLTHAAPVELYSSNSRYATERDFAVWHRFTGDEKNPYDCTVVFGHSGTYHYQQDNPMKELKRCYKSGGAHRSDTLCLGCLGYLGCLRIPLQQQKRQSR